MPKPDSVSLRQKMNWNWYLMNTATGFKMKLNVMEKTYGVNQQHHTEKG